MAARTILDAPAEAELTCLYYGAVRADDLFLHRVASSTGFRIQLKLKRIADIAISGLMLIVLSPVLVIAGLAVRFSSPGPAVFWQWRWGKDQRRFRFFKFRSMYIDQGSKLGTGRPNTDNCDGILLKMKNDPRVTGIGRLLRKTSIDELPQLFNVLRGDMSMVGPRPLVLHMMEPFPEIRAARSVIRPGLTGLWQIRSRANNTSVMDMIAHDVEYIATLSLWLDLKIMLATPWEVVRGNGAH